jgi:hypothetical protein
MFFPLFSYSILDSSAPISGVIKTHELFRFFFSLLLFYFIPNTQKKYLVLVKDEEKKKHVSPVGVPPLRWLFFVHFSSIFSSYVF